MKPDPFQRLFICFIPLILLLSGCGKGGDFSPHQRTATSQVVIISMNPPPSPSGGGGFPTVTISQIPLPQALFQTSAVTYTYIDSVSSRSYLYVMGGAYYDPSQTDPINVNTVYSSQVLQNGTLSNWQVESNRLPLELRGHTSVIYSNAIYVIGGIGMGGFQKSIYKSTITMNGKLSYPALGPWTYVGSLPVEETGHASVVSSNMLYVIGGVESGFPPPGCNPNCVGSQTTVFSDQIYGYDISGPGFSSTPLFNFTMPKKLYTPAAVATSGTLNDQLWVLGGWDGTANTNSSTAFSFSISGGGLSCLTITCETTPLPVGLSKASAILIPDLSWLFLIGGVSGSVNDPEVARREVYYSPTSGPSLSWKQIYSLPKAVSYFSSTFAGTNIYVLGGLAS